MTTVIDDLSRSRLAREIDLLLFDTKKSTAVGRSLWQAMTARIRLWRDWWLALGGTPSVAHIHTCSGLSYFLDGALVVIARLRGVPSIVHIHGARFDAFLDGLSPPAAWIARCIARTAARVIVLSEEWQGRMLTRLGNARLAIVENGIALVEPGTRSVGNTVRLPKILFLGNLGKRKGVWELLDAFAALTPHCRLALVGGEEDHGVTDAVRAKCRALSIDERVEVPGPVHGAEKYRWLQEADIFVLPSHAEGLPMSLLEAMSAGLPVVTTPVGGIPSVIRSGENGLLVPAGDVPALTEALCHLLQSASERRRLGSAAQALVTERYGVDRAAGQLLEIYRELLV